MPNILLISDNQDLKKQIENHSSDFVVIEEGSDKQIDLVVIDDDENKIQQYKGLPIILLSSHDIIASSEVLFIKKPFNLRAFLEKLGAYVKIFENSPDFILSWGEYTLLVPKKEIYNQHTQKYIKLTEKEVEILKYLYKNKNKIISKTELLENVWGYNPEISTHTIETHIYRLRQKVESSSKDNLIRTIDGGYCL